MRARVLAAACAVTLACASPAVAAERLAFPSRAAPRGQAQLELADPVGGGGQLFASANSPLFDPSWSPDDKTIAYDEGFGQRIVLKPVAGGAERTFLTNAGRPSWSPVADEIAYWTAPAEPYKYMLTVTTADGQVTRPVAGPYDIRFDIPLVLHSQPAWSADGKTIAFALKRGIYTVPAAGGQATQRVAGGPTNSYVVHSPSFAPDGRQLAYVKSFDDQGAFTAWQLVVRNLQNGQERTLASGSSSPGDISDVDLGPQSWSPDSDEVAYAEQHTIPTTNPSTHVDTVKVARSDGSRTRVLVQRPMAGGPAWGGGGPNYYIKHVEVTQSISPHLDAIEERDPLSREPYSFPWSEKNAFGHPLPLIAEKSTLIRVYVGDSSLAEGAIERRLLRVSLVDDGSGIDYGRPTPREVDVTAPDVLPHQEGEQATVNMWVPPEAVRPGARSFSIEVNPGQEEPECADCYPHGNIGRLQNVRPVEAGNIVIAPVPITVFAKSGEPRHPSADAFRDAFGAALPALPVRDDGATFTRPAGQLFVLKEDLTPEGGCVTLLKALLQLQASPGVAGPISGFGATRWVGYAAPLAVPRNTAYCGGKADSIPGRSFAIIGYDWQTLAHELGHTLGLSHTIGLSPKNVAPFALPLPYAGIGSVGTQVGVGGVTEIFRSAATADLMSYDSTRWTSPKSWHLMFERILGESGAIQSAGAGQRARAPVKGPTVKAPTVQRVVSGVLNGKDTAIESYVAETDSVVTDGPSAARVLAIDARGKVVARAVIHGTPDQEDGEKSATLPFLVTLPDKRGISSLQVLPMHGSKPLTHLRASRHAPKGHFLKLPRRARAKRSLTVGWKASDRDRRDDLSVMLLARRGTAGWRTIVLGPARGRIAVKPSTLGKGKALRMRLRVSDGFDTTVVNARRIILR